MIEGVSVTDLPSGMKVVASQSAARSVALSILIRAGSRNDPPGKNGLAHLVEHMVFKGTARHSAAELARIIDGLGGHLDGATTKESTFYYTSVLAPDLAPALENMLELVREPKFAPEDLERERMVVLEEIQEAEDDPGDTVFRLLNLRLFGSDHPLGQPVMGTKTSVETIASDDLWAFFRTHYRPELGALVVAGNAKPEPLMKAALKFTAAPEKDLVDPLRCGSPAPEKSDSFTSEKISPLGFSANERDIQQVHLALGFPTVSATSSDRYGIEVLSALLGGGVSSALFQRVREEEGLAYSIFSTTAYHTDAGALSVYAVTEEGKLPRVLELITMEIEKLGRMPPNEGDLGRAVRRLVNGFLLGLESPVGQMFRLAQAVALGQELLSPDEIVHRLQAVTAEEVMELAARYLQPKAAMALVGPRVGRLERVARRFLEVD